MSDARDEPDDVGSSPVEYRLLDLDEGELAEILGAFDQAEVRHRLGRAAIEVHPDDEPLADAVLDELYGPDLDAATEPGSADDVAGDVDRDDDSVIDAVFDEVLDDGPVAGPSIPGPGIAGPDDRGPARATGGPEEGSAADVADGDPHHRGGSPSFDAALLRVEELAATGGPVYDLDDYDEEALGVLIEALERAKVRYALAGDGSLVVHRNDEQLTDAVLDQTFGPSPSGPSEPGAMGRLPRGGAAGPAGGSGAIQAQGADLSRNQPGPMGAHPGAARLRWALAAVVTVVAVVVVVLLLA